MREMKKTGVAWCPEIPSDWYIDKVKNHFYISKQAAAQATPTVLSLARSGVKVRDISNNEGQLAASYDNYNVVQPNDFLLNPMDLYSGANCNVSEISGVISPAYINLRSSKQLNPKYFDYYFKCQYWTMAMFAHGKGISFDNRWTINAEAIKNYFIPVPSYQEQNDIVAKIDAKYSQVDALISNTEKQIAKLKEYKQSLITEVVTKGLDPTVPMKDSGVDYLGFIPQNWQIISIGRAFNYIGGYAFKSELFTMDETDNQVLRIGNIKSDNLVLDSKQIYINDDYALLANSAKVKSKDILFTMTGTKGKRDYFYTLIVGEKDIVEKNLFINQRVGIFRKKNSKINMDYANYVLKEKKILDYIFFSETGTANQGNLGIENISRTKLHVPSLKEQEMIAEYLDGKCKNIDQLIAIKQSKIEKLNAYKKSLIYEYVTGKKEA